jgi:hypothetical protein
MQPRAELDEIVAASSSVWGWAEGEDAWQIALASYNLPADAVIVEVGVFMGRCTVLLAGPRRLRGSGLVHCVDPFDCSGDAFSVPYYEQGLDAADGDSLEDVFRANLSRLELEPWIEVHRSTAIERAAEWSEPVDLLLLDGDQTPAGARAAYEAWLPHLKAGGTMVLRNTRDRQYAEGHDGHRRLVLEELHPPNYREIRQVGETTFAIKANRS